MIEVLANKKSSFARTNLSYNCYTEWLTLPLNQGIDKNELLLGAMSVALNLNCLELLLAADILKIIGNLEEQLTIDQKDEYEHLMGRLFSIDPQLLMRLDQQTRRAYRDLLRRFGRDKMLKGFLEDDIPVDGVTSKWLSDLQYLVQPWAAGQLSSISKPESYAQGGDITPIRRSQTGSERQNLDLLSIIKSPHWRDRSPQVIFKDSLRIADQLMWTEVARPVVEQAIQMLQDPEIIIKVSFNHIVRLFRWSYQELPENVDTYRRLIPLACWAALAVNESSEQPTYFNRISILPHTDFNDTVWDQIASQVLLPPITNRNWLRDNLDALNELSLSDWVQVLIKLNECAPDEMSETDRATFDETINTVHIQWFLKALKADDNDSNPITKLPKIKTHLPTNNLIAAIREECLASPNQAVIVLSRWTREGLNWLANSQTGSDFLAELKQAIHQQLPTKSYDILAKDKLPLMIPPLLKGQFKIWGEPGIANVRVICTQKVIEAVEEHAKSRPRQKVGGVLFGNVYQYEGNTYTEVSEYYIITTDSDNGKFVFTSEAMLKALDVAEQNYEEIVGWVRSSPDYGVFLSTSDHFIQDALYRQPWHIILIFDPVRYEGGFFIRQDSRMSLSSGFFELFDSNRKDSIVEWQNFSELQREQWTLSKPLSYFVTSFENNKIRWSSILFMLIRPHILFAMILLSIFGILIYLYLQ